MNATIPFIVEATIRLADSKSLICHSFSLLPALMTMFAMASVMLLVSQWLQVVEELSPLKAGFYLLQMAVGSLIFAPIAPKLAARLGAKIVLPSGITMAAIGFFIMYIFGDPLTYPVLAVALVLVGAGTASLAVASAIIMLGTPAEKAGNAAAIEESMYDIGNVFGVAILGSLASQIYRAYLDIESFASNGIVGDLAYVANESVVGAVEVAKATGLTKLATEATAAFSDSFVLTALIGGVVMIVVAIVIYILIPKSLDITKAEHH